MSTRAPTLRSRMQRNPLGLVSLLGYSAPPLGYAPPPVPVPYPTVFPAPPAKTPQGIGNLRWALVLGAVMQAVAIPGFAWFALLAYQFSTSGTPTDPSALLSILFMGLLLSCVTAVVGLIALIFFVMGFYNAHEGREEYGPLHLQDMDRGLIYFIIAIVMAIVASFGGFGLGSFMSPSPFGVVSGAFGAVRGLLVGLLITTLVKVFLSKEDRDLGWVGTAILTAAPATGGGVAVLLFLSFSPAAPFAILELVPLAFAVAAGLAGAELVAYLLFYRMYSKVLRRMRAGEFPPIVRPPLLYSPYYPWPAYYPPYPTYPPAPPAPPPTPPPGTPP